MNVENSDVDKKNLRVNSITEFATKTFGDGVDTLRDLLREDNDI